MNNLLINTAQNVSIQYTIASLGDRIWAHIIDNILIGVYIVAIFGLFAAVSGGAETFVILFFVVALLPVLFYHFLFELFNNGQSPGKRALNIRVVMLDGTPLTLGALFIRWIFRIVDFDILTGGVAVFVVAINGKGQRIGDIVAGTTVVRTVIETKDNVFSFTAKDSDGYKPNFPEVSSIPESQMLLIRQSFIQARNTDNVDLFVKTADAVTRIANIHQPSGLTSQEFVELVLKDYYYYNNKV